MFISEQLSPSALALHSKTHCCLVEIPLRVSGGVPRGTRQGVVVGVPLPQGGASEEWRWEAAAGEAAMPCQVAVLARWADGSPKWLSARFIADGDALGTGEWQLRGGPGEEELPAERVRIETGAGGEIVVTTGGGRFRLAAGDERLLRSAEQGGKPLLGAGGCSLVLVDGRGRARRPVVERMEVVERGPVRGVIQVSGYLNRREDLRFAGTLSFYAGTGQVRVELTAQNPRRARHRGGFWDLGDPGSILIKEWSLDVDVAVGDQGAIAWQEHAEAPVRSTGGGSLRIHQESSGGEQWNSRNHVNRHGQVPLRYRGYRVTTSEGETTGLRASPVVSLSGEGGSVAAAVEEFWERFPTAIEVQGNRLRVQMWPGESADVYELQGGEHNTRVTWLAFGEGGEAACGKLAWVHDPLLVAADGRWVADSGAMAYFPSPEAGQREELSQTLADAVYGPHSFFAKREVIDEYGWRNFGDLWADHEEAFYDGPRPIISHYNNQYDALHGFLVNYLLTGDRRWWQLGDALARHVMDIDIYHTEHDRAVYNGGLFWHSSHYLDAATSTHRSYSQATQPQGGGGLSNEHNYTAGLLLYYYLTGNRQARQAVVSLADWVMGMDDGSRHVLGLVHDGPTGFATRTLTLDYQGPGRGAGNSINALLDGWQATGRGEYLRKSEELIRRTIHPRDDVRAWNLGNAEERWSYTVYLQALLRILASSGELPVSPEMLAYIRECVLSCARWMAEHERFYLDRPEELEYPTETWAAQELRKGNVLKGAAAYAEGAEADAFRQKAEWIYDRAWRTLLSLPTRTYTRPLVLAVQLGLVEWWLRQRDRLGHTQAGNFRPMDMPRAAFIPQKTAVRQSWRSPAALLGAGLRLLRFWRWPAAARSAWPAQCLRTWARRIGG